MIFIYTLKV